MQPWSKIRLKADAAYACATVLAGHGHAQSAMQNLSSLRQGQSYFFPAACLPLDITSRENALFMSLVLPAGLGVANHDGLIFE
jgi:hypothetical protein